MVRVKKPFAFQKKILEQCLDELEAHDRTTMVMPCGSGKTLIGLWLAEALRVETGIVFAPTLGLLAQLAREWLANTPEKDIGCLAVCSDPYLINGLDEIRLAPEEYPFAVASDEERIRAYLDARIKGRKLIFCTYQSADLVGSAMRPGERIDLGIFDEAHRTAGKRGALFSFALSDKRLPMKKRVFMTATPRIYSRGPASVRELAYSMDNAQHYGRVCAAMTFAEAIALKIVCDYRVLISVITSGDLSLEEMNNSQLQNEEIDVRTAAARAGLIKALERYNINKVITFHATIEKARNFADKVMADFLPDYAKLHVNSGMTGYQRQRIMRQFAEEPKAIITNARCLTEGIDVPNVDMVVFMDPKGSEIDIIQAIGRSLRKVENKSMGHVFVPLFLDQRSGGESVAEALRRSRYEAVWNILSAFRSFDENLEQQAAIWRRNFGETREYRSPDWKRVEILFPGIGQEQIRESVEIFIAEELSDVWDEHYGQLLRFRETYGHVRVPQDHWLNGWLRTQRSFWNTRLTEERRQLLLSLGVDPSPRASKTERILRALADYAQKHGHCNMKKTDNKNLYSWLVGQKKKYHKGTLDAPMRAKLESLGIHWGNKVEKVFNDFVERYRAYLQKTGRPPRSVPTDQRKNQDPEELYLLGYLSILRQTYKEGKLSDERMAACQAMHIDLDPLTTQWNQRYEELLRWREQHGDSLSLGSPALHFRHWIQDNRQRYRRGTLPEERRDKLLALGIPLDYSFQQERWLKHFTSVQAYLQQHGVNTLPEHHPEYHWLERQLRQKQLEPKRAELLLSLNYIPPAKRVVLWTVQEKRILLRNLGLSLEKLQRLLPKRSKEGIKQMRNLLRRTGAITGKMEKNSKCVPWSAEEKQILRQNPDLSLEELQRLLPKRSKEGIKQMKKLLRRTGAK